MFVGHIRVSVDVGFTVSKKQQQQQKQSETNI